MKKNNTKRLNHNLLELSILRNILIYSNNGKSEFV